MSKRIEWIDSARGIAILFVVLGHCIGNIEDPVNKFILAFHMPLFFFLSGLCAKCKGDNKIKQILNKAKVLLVPQVTLGLLNCATQIVSGGGEKKEQLYKNFTAWFLLVLFYITVVFIIISPYLKSIHTVLLFSLFCIFVTSAISRFEIDTIMNAELIPTALAFFLLGYGCKLYFEKHKDFIEVSNVFMLLPFSVPVVVICSYWNTPVTMYNNGIGNPLLFLLGALAGIYTVCGVAVGLQNNKLLLFVGQNSIIIYVCHFAVLKALHLIGKTVFPTLATCNYLYPANWHYFLIAVLVLIPCILISNKYFPWMFGKKQVK